VKRHGLMGGSHVEEILAAGTAAGSAWPTAKSLIFGWSDHLHLVDIDLRAVARDRLQLLF
jgi:hypothetical protein